MFRRPLNSRHKLFRQVRRLPSMLLLHLNLRGFALHHKGKVTPKAFAWCFPLLVLPGAAGAVSPRLPLRELPSQIVVAVVETTFHHDDPKNVLRSLAREYRFQLDSDSYYMEQSGEGWDHTNSRVTDVAIKVLESTEEDVSLTSQRERPPDQIANNATIGRPDSSRGFWRQTPVPSLTLALYAPTLLPAKHVLSPNSWESIDEVENSSARTGRSRNEFNSALWVFDNADRPKQISVYSREGKLIYEANFEYVNSADAVPLPRWTQRFFDDGKLLSETKASVVSAGTAKSPPPSIVLPNRTFVSNRVEGTFEEPVEYWKDASGQMVRLSEDDMSLYLPLPPDQWPKPKATSWLGWLAAGGLVAGLTAILAAAIWNRRRRRTSHR